MDTVITFEEMCRLEDVQHELEEDEKIEIDDPKYRKFIVDIDQCVVRLRKQLDSQWFQYIIRCTSTIRAMGRPFSESNLMDKLMYEFGFDMNPFRERYDFFMKFGNRFFDDDLLESSFATLDNEFVKMYLEPDFHPDCHSKLDLVTMWQCNVNSFVHSLCYLYWMAHQAARKAARGCTDIEYHIISFL